MYFSTFPSSEYCFNEDIDIINEDTINEQDVCLICLIPSETNNQITILSEFSHIITLCKCKSKFHSSCLNVWIDKSHSCPICRKNITTANININRQNNYLELIYIFFSIFAIVNYFFIIYNVLLVCLDYNLDQVL
jgi:hypothetical protein